MRPTILIVALALSLWQRAQGQAIRTVNGSILLQIPGATLTLSQDGTNAQMSSASTLLTAADLNAAMANVISQTQPQINLALSSINSTNAGVTSASASLATERLRAVTAEAANTAAIGAEQVRATAVEGSLASSVAAELARALASEAALRIAESSIATSVLLEQIRAMTVESSFAVAVAAATLETPRAQAVEQSLALSVAQERSRALGAESSLSSSVANEMTRAVGVEASLAGSVAAEVARAQAAEAGLRAAESSIAASVLAEQQRALAVEASISLSNSQTQGSLSAAVASMALVGVGQSTALASQAATVAAQSAAIVAQAGLISSQQAALNNLTSSLNTLTTRQSIAGNSNVFRDCSYFRYLMSTPTSGVYTLPSGLQVYCDFSTNLATSSNSWTLLASFEQPAGQFTSGLSQTMYNSYCVNLTQWIQGNAEARPLSPEPLVDGLFHIRSVSWDSVLMAGRNYQLRQRFFKGAGVSKTAVFDVLYSFTYQGFIVQDQGQAIPGERAFVLTGRTVLTDTTGIAWNTPVEQVLFWLPFSPSATGNLYTACNSFAIEPTGCGAGGATSASRRYGNSGIIGTTADANDPAASWAPHFNLGASYDIVFVHQASNIYGQTGAPGAPIFLSYYISPL